MHCIESWLIRSRIPYNRRIATTYWKCLSRRIVNEVARSYAVPAFERVEEAEPLNNELVLDN